MVITLCCVFQKKAPGLTHVDGFDAAPAGPDPDREERLLSCAPSALDLTGIR